MCSKFILSSSGLRNIILNAKDNDDEFRFIFREKEIKLQRIFAEFISPRVSHMHQSDPTISCLDISELITAKTSMFSKNYEEILNEKTFQILSEISHGFPIDLDEESISKLRLLSVILDNEEIFHRMNELSQKVSNENDECIDFMIDEICVFKSMSSTFAEGYISDNIEFLKKHISRKHEKKLRNLPKSIFYMIIKDEHFQTDDNDFLVDIINEFANSIEEEEDNEIKTIEMFEAVDVSKLSSNKLREFASNFDYTEMTGNMWRNFCRCFSNTECFRREENVYEIEYDGNPSNRFCGIIHHIKNESISDDIESLVTVTASSTSGPYYPIHAIDFDNDNYFLSNNSMDWIQYDFHERKIVPTHYSIRTRKDFDGQNPISWFIEVSNTAEINDWKVIDSRENVRKVSKRNQSETFEIQKKLSHEESYRYIRFRNRGMTSNNFYSLAISMLEYFGTLIELS